MSHAATCSGLLIGRGPPLPIRRDPRARRPSSLVRATLTRNDATEVTRDHMVLVPLASRSRIIRTNGSQVWCARYPGLGGLFRKDRGPSKELGRALCDEVMERFGCDGFLTGDELPRYGIGREDRRTILAAVQATAADCVVLYSYPEALAAEIDEHLFHRLRAML